MVKKCFMNCNLKHFFCWTLLLIQNYVIYFLAINHREGVTSKRSLENQDELMQTTLTIYEVELPTNLATRIKIFLRVNI